MTATTQDFIDVESAAAGIDEIISETAAVSEKLKGYLGDIFALPEYEPNLKEKIVHAQNIYESAKGNETALLNTVALLKYIEVDVWEAALARASGSSQAAKKAEAETDPEWRRHEYRRLRLEAAKRDAEKWHSVAYQRLETLREIYKKS